ncbi:DUF72 domain-containing protein [bacterium]|nr:DUF72 domain-containing protein [bacterium]
MAEVFIGTSGWQYPVFSKHFYPGSLEKKEQLGYYAKQFPSVEVNNTFYDLPKPQTIANWVAQVPPAFCFSVKASRYITHMKNLLEPDETLPKFFDRIEGFGERLGPVLFQLPPNWQINLERLKAFLAALPAGYRYTFELRNSTWLCGSVYELLKKHGAAFCIYELNHRQSPLVSTADFVYIRLHGPGRAYRDPYSEQALSRWAERIEDWLRDDKDVYCYFDNTMNGHAWENARTLLEKVRG